MDFEARTHRVAQRLIPPSGNGGYPLMVVYYYRFVPFVTAEDGSRVLPLRPDPRLVEAAARIGSMADFIVITSNFLHVFQADIERAAGCEVLSMVDITLAHVGLSGWERVGVLGFGDPLVYTAPLTAMGLVSETVAGGVRTTLDNAIHKVMEGREDQDSFRAAREAVAELRARRVDGIILGCTEIPFLLGDEGVAADLLNPLQLIADAAVHYALA